MIHLCNLCNLCISTGMLTIGCRLPTADCRFIIMSSRRVNRLCGNCYFLMDFRFCSYVYSYARVRILTDNLSV